MKIAKLLMYSAGLVSGIGVAVAVVSSAGSNSSVIPYSFQDGQVISADTMNSLFTQVQNVVQGFQNEAELNGDWSCTTYDAFIPGAPINNSNLPESQFTIDQTTGLYSVTQRWTFSNYGSHLALNSNVQLGGIQNNVTGACPSGSSIEFGSKVIQSGLLLSPVGGACGGNGFALQLVKNSPYQFHFTQGSTYVSCIAVNQPPNSPSGLVASASNGGGVNLTWTDNGGSPTGFIVLKRINGKFQQIGTATSATFTDTTGVPGDLYRVESMNGNGSSLPSAAALAG